MGRGTGRNCLSYRTARRVSGNAAQCVLFVRSFLTLRWNARPDRTAAPALAICLRFRSFGNSVRKLTQPRNGTIRCRLTSIQGHGYGVRPALGRARLPRSCDRRREIALPPRDDLLRILGLVPLMIARSASKLVFRDVSTPVFGGMPFASLSGIFVIPPIYVMVQAIRERLRPAARPVENAAAKTRRSAPG